MVKQNKNPVFFSFFPDETLEESRSSSHAPFSWNSTFLTYLFEILYLIISIMSSYINRQTMPDSQHYERKSFSFKDFVEQEERLSDINNILKKSCMQ